MSDPLVSVGIPTYNRPDGLRKALECVLGQSYQNLEVIVSDNASPNDETERVVMEFAACDQRVRYHRQPTNIGPLRNFRSVLGMATGEYFAWVADDDLCSADFFRELVRPLQADPRIALAMCDLTMIRIGEDPNAPIVSEVRLSSLRGDEVDQFWARVRRRFFAYPTSNIFFCIYGLYRTEILRRCRMGFPSRWKGITYASEVPLLAQVAVQGKIVSVAQTLKTYVLHEDSTWVRETKQIGRVDRLIRDLELRVELTYIAWRSALPWKVKADLALYPWVSRVLQKIARTWTERRSPQEKAATR